MKKLLLGVVATTALTIGSLANAGILIEPYLGYHTGKAESGSSSNDIKGMVYGGRFGFQRLGLIGGVDYMTGKSSYTSNGLDVDMTPTDLGAFVGYQFPVMVRAYFVYNFKSEAALEVGSFSNTLKGKGMKLGVGYTGFPVVSINLEYYSSSYDEDDSGALNPESTLKSYGITISAPFDL